MGTSGLLGLGMQPQQQQQGKGAATGGGAPPPKTPNQSVSHEMYPQTSRDSSPAISMGAMPSSGWAGGGGAAEVGDGNKDFHSYVGGELDNLRQLRHRQAGGAGGPTVPSLPAGSPIPTAPAAQRVRAPSPSQSHAWTPSAATPVQGTHGEGAYSAGVGEGSGAGARYRGGAEGEAASLAGLMKAAQYPNRGHLATPQQQTWAQGGDRGDPAGISKGALGAAAGAGARQPLQSPGAGGAALQVPQKSPACSKRAPVKSPTNALQVPQKSANRCKEPRERALLTTSAPAQDTPRAREEAPDMVAAPPPQVLLPSRGVRSFRV